MPREKKLIPEKAAKEWIILTAQAKKIANRLEELAEFLKPLLEEEPDKAADWNGWRFKLVEYEREAFSLQKARDAGVDGRILAPYISRSQVKFIKPTWQGGDELAA